MPLYEQDAITVVQGFKNLPEEAKPAASAWMKRYADQQDELGLPLFPSEEAQTKASKERYRSMFTDLRKVDEIAPTVTTMMAWSDSPDADRARVANANFLAKRYNKTPQEIHEGYDLYKQDYLVRSREKSDMDDLGLYAIAKKEVEKEVKAEQLHDDARQSAMNAALADRPALQALNEWQGLNAGPQPSDRLEATPAFLRIYSEVSKRLRPHRDIIERTAELGRGMDTNPNGAPWSQMADLILQVPKKDRRLVLEALANAAPRKEGESQQDAVQRVFFSFDRGLERLTDQGGSAYMGRAMSDIVESAEASPFLSEAQRKEVGEAAEGAAKYLDLRDDLRDIATQKLAPVSPTRFLGANLNGIAENLPLTLASFVPYVGPALTIGQFHRETVNNLRAQYPEMSRADRESVASWSSPFQALEEVVGNRLLVGRWPNLSRIFTTPALRPFSAAAGFGGKLVLGGMGETTEEFLQGATPLAVMEIQSAMKLDRPDSDWDSYWSSFKKDLPELLSIVIPMAMVGAGGAQLSDFGSARNLARSEQALLAAKYSPDAAKQISLAAQGGDWSTAEQMMRQDWKRINAKAEPLSQVAATAFENAKKQVVTEMRTAQRDVETAMRDAEVSVRRSESGWQVITLDTTNTFPDHESAYLAAVGEMERQEMTRDEQTMRAFEGLSRNAAEGQEFRLSDRDSSMQAAFDEAEGRGDQAEMDAIWKRAEIFRKQVADPDVPLSNMRVLGRSSTEFREGVKHYVQTLYAGGRAADLVEEKAESDVKRWLAEGRGTADWLRAAIQQVEKTTGDAYIHGDTDTALVEAYSSMARLYASGTAKGDAAQAVRRDARERRRKLKSASGPLMQFFQETMDFFREVLRRAYRLHKAKQSGALGDLETWLNESVGMTEQSAHVDAVSRDAGSLAEADPASFSIALSDRLDALAGILDEQTKARPESRRAILERAQERLSVAKASWERIDRQAKAASRAASDTPDHYGTELAQLRADFDADLAEIRAERETEIGGARQDKAGKETVNRIKAEFSTQIEKRRTQYERDRRAIEDKQSAEEAAQAREQGRISRQELTAAMRALDAVVAVLPAEIRGKVGGFIKLSELTTTAARIDEIEARFEKVGGLLEKHFQKELTAQVEKLFDRYRPERSSGEKPKGKLDPDAQELVDAAEAAMGMTAQATTGELGSIDALLADPDITAEQEVHLGRKRVLVELFGDWKGADASRMSAALDALQATASEGWAKWRFKQLQKKEARQAVRDSLQSETGKQGLGRERDSMLEESAGVIGKTRDTFLNLSSFAEVLKFVFGSKSKTVQALTDSERQASNQYEDAIQGMAERVQDHFTQLAGGVLKGEQMRFDMSKPKITVGKGRNQRTLSELQGIQALLMWQQEDGRRHMEGPRDEANQPLPDKWSYDQEWIDDLTAKLPPRALRTKSFLEGLYAAEYGPLNALYRERHGVNLPQHKLYAPITVAPQQAKAGEMVDPVSGAAVTGSILTPGALRSRARTAVAEPRFEDALATLLAHNKQMEHWKAYYDFAVDAQAVMGNRSLMNSVEAAAGKEAVKMLRKWVEAFAQGGMRDAAAGMAVTGWAQKLASRAATIGLLGRVSTLLVQSTQLAAANVQMPTGAYVLRLSKLLTGQLSWGDAVRSEFIQRRIQTAPPIVQQAMQELGKASRPNQITRAVRGLGNLLSGADGLFTGGTYAILLDWHRGQGARLGLEGTELEAYAHQEAARATEEVAQPVRMGTRSMTEITMTNPFAKVGWAYASEARQKITLFAWAAKNGRADKARFGKAAFLTFVAGGLMSQVLKNLWKDMKGDDDEGKWSAQRLLTATVAAPLHGVPLLSELAGEGGMLSGFVWGKKAFTDIMTGEGDLRDFETLLSTAGYFHDSLAGIAALSHLGFDSAHLIQNAFSNEK